MAPLTPAPQHRSFRGGWLLVAALLLGLVWMHGLVIHGGAAHASPAEASASASVHADHAGEASTSTEHGVDEEAGALGDGGHGGTLGGVVLGLCMAVLAGAAAVLFVFGRRARGRYEGPATGGTTSALRAASHSRRRDPPSPTNLGILRC